MGYISARRARIQRNLAAVQASLEAAYASQLEASSTTVQSYEFDSGEGKQRTTRRTLKALQDQIDRLEAKERSLINELYNMGLVSIRLRRKRPSCY
jgi:hypothetical protein